MTVCEYLDPEMERFTDELSQLAYRYAIPLQGTFELTPRCNFNCKMCYIHLSNEQADAIGRELTNEEWLKIAQDAKDAGMLYLTLTGGEIFSRPNFKELYIELSKMGFLISLLTNGALINEDVLGWLSEYPPYRIRITLYGVSNETYYDVCGIQNGFDNVDHAIDLIKEAGIPLSLVGTIINLNEKDLKLMYEYSHTKHLPFAHSIAIAKPVRGAIRNVENYRLDVKNAPESVKKALAKSPRIYHGQHPMDDCGSYRECYWITWNGDMILCSFLSKPKVSVMDYDFITAWNTLNHQLRLLKKPEKCISCKYEYYCKKCPGKLNSECGDINNPTNSFCNKAKYLYELCSLTKEGGKNEKSVCETGNTED